MRTLLIFTAVLGLALLADLAAVVDIAHGGFPFRPSLLVLLLAAVIGAQGEAIVSGLLLADVAGVLASWRAQGFTLAERIDLEGWASLRFRR